MPRCCQSLPLAVLVASLAASPSQVAAQPCVGTFEVPPNPPSDVKTHNGVHLQDVCINKGGYHHVLVVGDWGGIVFLKKVLMPADKRSRLFPLFKRPFITGVDDRAQLLVAKAMESVAAEYHPDYIINVGDNFYWGGIDGQCGAPPMTEPYSKQWNQVFEQVYQGSLAGIPWLGVLGNHDYGGFQFTSKWAENIGYSWKSKRWVTPAMYWAVRVRYPDVSVDWIFVETNAVEAWTKFQNEDHNLCSQFHNAKVGTCGPYDATESQGPLNVDTCHAWFWTVWHEQFPWMIQALETSLRSDYQIIVTHFPPKWLQSTWQCLSERYGIDLHISGHIHHQQAYGPDDPLNFLSGGTCSVVSGGGGGITSEGIPSRVGDDDQYGFMDLLIKKDVIKVHALSHMLKLRKTISCPPRGANLGQKCDGGKLHARRLRQVLDANNATFI